MESKINFKRRSVIEETEDEGEAFVPDNDEITIAKKDTENPNKGALFYMLNNHQWVFAIWLIPISLCYDLFWWCRARIFYWLFRRNSNLRLRKKQFKLLNIIFKKTENKYIIFLLSRHDDKVKNVQRQIEEWMASGSDQPMCTARPGWQSITLQQQHYKKRMYNIHIDLPDILEIDEENKFVRVEPMVTIGMSHSL